MKKENRPKLIGNIYGDKKGTGFAGNVWETEGLCPTLTTMGGGNQQPLILTYEESNDLRKQGKDTGR